MKEPRLKNIERLLKNITGDCLGRNRNRTTDFGLGTWVLDVLRPSEVQRPKSKDLKPTTMYALIRYSKRFLLPVLLLTALLIPAIGQSDFQNFRQRRRGQAVQQEQQVGTSY